MISEHTKSPSTTVRPEARLARAETRTFKAVFPNTTNHYDTLFGGTALYHMDEVAFLTATRFSRQRMVTVSAGQTDFSVPIPAGTIVEFVGRISKVGRTSIRVAVEVYVEEMYAEGRVLAVSGEFAFVAVDEAGQKTLLSDSITA